jgi:hypothetical protein
LTFHRITWWIFVDGNKAVYLFPCLGRELWAVFTGFLRRVEGKRPSGGDGRSFKHTSIVMVVPKQREAVESVAK